MSIKAPILGSVRASEVRARDSDGLKLYEDGGAGVFVKDGGYVGIGTNAPDGETHIKGSAYPELKIESTDIEGGQVVLKSSTGYYVLRQDGEDLNFYKGGNKMTLLGNGTFGIGTASPLGILHTESDIPVIRFYDSGLLNTEKATFRLGKEDAANKSFGIEFQYDTGGVSKTSFHHYGDDFKSGLLIQKGGNVGIGTIAPANPLAVNRSADGVIVDFESADAVEGNISIAGNTTSYNAFMGAHYTQLKDGQKIPPVGAIVVATGEIIACESHIEIPDVKAKKTKGKSGTKVITKDVSGVERKEYFSYVELASQKADKRVYGVYHARLSDDSKGQSFGEDNKAVHQIAALGLYKVRVTDTNRDIAAGDYIQSSIRPGEGEKQDDDILHNYTVAKSIIDVKWAKVIEDSQLGYKWLLIPATLHCG